MLTLRNDAAECNEEILPDGGCCGGFDDRGTDPVDTGAEEPQPEENERQVMAQLKSIIVARAARIESEVGGCCKIDALVSSDEAGVGGFLCWIDKGGHRGFGHGTTLDDAEDEARADLKAKEVAAWRKAVAL